MATQALKYKSQIISYEKQEVLTLSQSQLIEKLYNLGIRGCYQKDSTKVSKVLTELISALDFTYREIAMGFFRLYEYCLGLVKSGKFDETLNILKELEEAWKNAVKDSL